MSTLFTFSSEETNSEYSIDTSAVVSIELKFSKLKIELIDDDYDIFIDWGRSMDDEVRDEGMIVECLTAACCRFVGLHSRRHCILRFEPLERSLSFTPERT